MLIHVGYPKTASTWLQSELFSGEVAKIRQAISPEEIRNRVIRPYPLWYDHEGFRREWQQRIEGVQAEGYLPVLSQELLVGHPVSGGYESTLVAERLHALWPEARILIIVRQQPTMLLSLYKEYIHNGGYLSLSQYMNPPGRDRQPTFDFRYLEFHRLVSHYVHLFGTGNVLVLPFEAFVRDKVEFCNRILKFVGLPPIHGISERHVRKSMGGWTVMLRSRLNRLFHGDRNNPVAPCYIPQVARLVNRLDSMWPRRLHAWGDRQMSMRIAAEIKRRYTDSNRQLAADTGCDLNPEPACNGEQHGATFGADGTYESTP